MSFSSDETDEFNAGLTTIGELTKTVSDGTQSDIVAREEEFFEASSYVSEDVVENSTSNTIERRNKSAMHAVLKARLARAKSPEAQRAKGPSTPSSMRGDPPAQKAGGEARTKACRRGVQRGALSLLPTTRPFTEAPRDHQVDDWACGVVKGLQRRAVPLRTSKGSTSSRRTRGSCLGIKQEVPEEVAL